MRTGLPVLLLATACCLTARAAEVRTWDFDGPITDWQEPAGECGIVNDPGNPDNRVYRIAATRPHHTQLRLADSVEFPNFVASCRLKVLSWEGDPPGLYIYGRLGGGFRGISMSRSGSRLFAYYGQGERNPQLGTASISYPVPPDAWLNVKLACWDDYAFGKVWLEGSPEPVFQMSGDAPDQPEGLFAIGAWTSPRTPSSAVVLIDDVTFQPLTEEDLEGLKVRVGPRPPLDIAGIIERGTFQSGSHIGLATGDTILTFERDTGQVSHIVHRPTGQDFVSPRDFRPLFNLTLTKPYEGGQLSVSSDEFRTIRVRPVRTGLELTYGDHPSVPLRASVRVTARDETARMGLSIENDSDWAVASIAFPDVVYRAPLGEDLADDCLVLPWADGAILPAPGGRSQSQDRLYPGQAFTQFTALYDDRAGLYFAAEDTGGHCKEWRLRTVQDRSVHMGLVHRVPEVRGQGVALSYDIVLRTFTGDWRDAADLYKSWAVNQPWCARPLAQRPEVPQFLKDGSGVVIVSVNNPVGREKNLGSNLEHIAERAAAYRERTGLAHVIFVAYGWENRGTWAGINYLPAVPSDEDWKRAAASLKAQGDRAAFMTSGFWWVIKRQKTSNGPAFDDTAQFERLKDMVIHRADGTPWFTDNYEKLDVHGSWRGLSAKLCHGSPDALDTMQGLFLDIARLGVPLISFDQEIGGGQTTPCYSRSHGHPPGFGPWMWTNFRDLCARILKEGKTVEPELGLFVENVSELAIPYMSTYWSRQFAEVDYGNIDARGVGLFSYLYHEYVTAIGAACVQGQGQQGTRPHPGLRVRIMANNLTRGLIPGPFHHDVPLEPANDWQRTISSAFFSYCQPYARFPEYLVLGTTRRPPELECDDVDLWFYRASAEGEQLTPNGPRVVKVPISLPAVTAGSFEAEDRSLGTIIVNSTGDQQEAVLKLARVGNSATLYRADRTEVRRWDQPAADLEIRLSLEPYGTRMLIVQ